MSDTDEQKHISVQVDAALRERVEAAAEREQRSLSSFVRHALVKAVEHRQQGQSA